MENIKSEIIAQAVKDYLVCLAVNDELPSDLNQLSVTGLSATIRSAIMDGFVHAYLDANFIEGEDYILADMVGDDDDSCRYYNYVFLKMVDAIRKDILQPADDELSANHWVESYLDGK